MKSKRKGKKKQETEPQGNKNVFNIHVIGKLEENERKIIY